MGKDDLVRKVNKGNIYGWNDSVNHDARHTVNGALNVPQQVALIPYMFDDMPAS